MSVLRHSQKSEDLGAGGYNYYWSGRPEGILKEGIHLITEVTLVNERIMRLRISHTLRVFSLVSVCAPTGLCEFSANEAFYAKLQMVVDWCPKGIP